MVLGVIAPLVLGVFMTVIGAAAMYAAGPEHIHHVTSALMLAMLPVTLGTLWFTVISFWCLYDILAGRVPSGQRIVWLVAWLFANMFAVWAWVYLYEVKRA